MKVTSHVTLENEASVGGDQRALLIDCKKVCDKAFKYALACTVDGTGDECALRGGGLPSQELCRRPNRV